MVLSAREEHGGDGARLSTQAHQGRPAMIVFVLLIIKGKLNRLGLAIYLHGTGLQSVSTAHALACSSCLFCPVCVSSLCSCFRWDHFMSRRNAQTSLCRSTCARESQRIECGRHLQS